MTQPNDSNTFLKFAAYLQIIGIVFVVLGHSFFLYPDGNHGMNTLLYRMMYNFRMPLFMFVSGFLMVYTTFGRGRARHPARFAANKAKRLLLPFFVLSIVTFVPRAMMSGMAEDSIELSPGSFAVSLFNGHALVIPYFWFLQASFLLLTVNYLGMYLCRRSSKATAAYLIAATLFFAVLPLLEVETTAYFSVCDAVRLGVYFALGMSFSYWYGDITSRVDFANMWLLMVFAALWATIFIYGEGTPAARIASVFGILMCVSAAMLLDKKGIRFLDHLIGANYIIFLLSWYCNVATQQVLSHFIALPWWVHTALSLISGIYVPWLAYRYLRRHPGSRWVKFTSLLLGQRFAEGSAPHAGETRQG